MVASVRGWGFKIMGNMKQSKVKVKAVLINKKRADHATPTHQLMDGLGFMPHAATSTRTSSVTTGRSAPASAEAAAEAEEPHYIGCVIALAPAYLV